MCMVRRTESERDVLVSRRETSDLAASPEFFFRFHAQVVRLEAVMRMTKQAARSCFAGKEQCVLASSV